MAYLAPNWFTRKVFNPTAMSLGIMGTEMLTVQGRQSGRPMRVPVIPVDARPSVIAAYRDSVGHEVERYFDRLPDAADHPVFLVDAEV